MSDIFKISGPATLAFSGGRTSAYTLWRTLQAHGGALPADVIPIFTNTGKERPEALDFVQQCAERWSAPVVWLEYRRGTPGYEKVNHNNASRAGEPFNELIEAKRYLPNGVTRFCTIELKIRPPQKYVQAEYGWKRWTNVVGFRADEMRRVNNACGRNESGKGAWRTITPLATAGVTKAHVQASWRAQPFDLQLEEHEGNCDLCFLKRRSKLRHIMYDRPDLAAWWIEQERRAQLEYGATAGSRFRPSYSPDYAHLLATRAKQEEFELEEPDALDLCYCADAA